MSLLLDAGPVLDFLAVGQENALIQYASARGMQLATPERVNREVLGKARSPRFNRTGVEGKWKTLTASRITLLDDSLNTTAFVEAIERIANYRRRFACGSARVSASCWSSLTLR